MRPGRVQPVARPVAGACLVALAWAGLRSARPAVAQPEPPACIVTVFQLAGVGPGALGLAMGTADGPCWGPYVFEGVRASALGFPASTTDDVGELARALAQWVPADGAPPVDQWVGLSPALAAAFRAAGIDPTRFLQWLNEFDGAGTVGHPEAPPTWPPFLPRGLVADPASALRSPPDLASSEPSGLPAAPPGPGVRGAPAPAADGQGGGQATGPRTAAPPPAARTVAARGRRVGRPAAAAAPAPEAAPPQAASVEGVSVPCAVSPACRRAVLAFDRFRARPWFVRLALRAARRAGLLGAAIGGAALALASGRLALGWRRNRLWYGRARGPD